MRLFGTQWPAGISYERRGEIVNLMITLIHLGARPPLRGEELVLDQIENGCQLRTLYLVFGQMLAIRRRSKDTRARGINMFNEIGRAHV